MKQLHYMATMPPPTWDLLWHGMARRKGSTSIYRRSRSWVLWWCCHVGTSTLSLKKSNSIFSSLSNHTKYFILENSYHTMKHGNSSRAMIRHSCCEVSPVPSRSEYSSPPLPKHDIVALNNRSLQQLIFQKSSCSPHNQGHEDRIRQPSPWTPQSMHGYALTHQHVPLGVKPHWNHPHIPTIAVMTW